MGDKRRGLYRKFLIERTDGLSAPGKKHDGCAYFVLDLTHDIRYSIAALQAYASACAQEYPKLAEDLCNSVIPDLQNRLRAEDPDCDFEIGQIRERIQDPKTAAEEAMYTLLLSDAGADKRVAAAEKLAIAFGFPWLPLKPWGC